MRVSNVHAAGRVARGVITLLVLLASVSGMSSFGLSASLAVVAIVLGVPHGALDLEDGRLHVIEWARSVTGSMTVSLDGTALIQTSDTRLRDPFDGFGITNLGGDYAVRSISVQRGQ